MTIEQQVVSLDLAKRLKELGVGQNSLFGWYAPIEGHERMSEKDDPSVHLIGSGTEWSWHELVCSAFTVAELGEMLPLNIEVEEKRVRLYIKSGLKEKWSVDYYSASGQSPWMELFESNNEADARAKMLIWLIESNLLPASHCG